MPFRGEWNPRRALRLAEESIKSGRFSSRQVMAKLLNDPLSSIGSLGLDGFGFLVNALGGGGDAGQSFPQSDAQDLQMGAMFIPGEVTMARRRGERVQFITRCGPNCWYWLMPDGTKIYHYNPVTFGQIARANGKRTVPGRFGMDYPDGAGSCPNCGNVNTSGGTVKP